MLQADIQDMNSHVEFLAAARDVEASALQHLDFADFLLLYINHRPLFPVTQDDVIAAFKDLGAKGNPGARMRMAAAPAPGSHHHYHQRHHHGMAWHGTVCTA